MKIINLFSLFQNPYRAPGWQVWRGRDLLAVFHTRAQARAYARARAEARAREAAAAAEEARAAAAEEARWVALL